MIDHATHQENLQRLAQQTSKGMKVAIVHDWLVAYAGADRVVDQMHVLFPNAPIYTLVYDKKNMPKRFETYDIRTTFVQKIPFATRIYKWLLTLMPRAFEQLDLMAYDLVISSCSCCSKGVITRPDAVHICYCNTPIRYAWDFYHVYLKQAHWLKRLVMPSQMSRIRLWDYAAAGRVDHFIANSNYIAKRIQKYYRREADVIYPSVHINEMTPPDHPDDYYLMVGRFTHYKRMDLGVLACVALGKRLIVVGGGEMEKTMRALANQNVTFLGKKSDEEIRTLYRNAKAFLFPGEEDFGITVVEAQSAGCPVLAFGRGGALETVRDGETGYFFDEQSKESLMQCMERFEKEGVAYDRQAIKEHSKQFSEERFRCQFLQYCLQKCDEHHLLER